MISQEFKAAGVRRMIQERAKQVPESERVPIRYADCKRSASKCVDELLAGKFSVLYIPEMFSHPGLPFHALTQAGQGTSGTFFAKSGAKGLNEILSFVDRIKLPPAMDRESRKQLTDALIRPLVPIMPEEYEGMIQ